MITLSGTFKAYESCDEQEDRAFSACTVMHGQAENPLIGWQGIELQARVAAAARPGAGWRKGHLVTMSAGGRRRFDHARIKPALPEAVLTLTAMKRVECHQMF
jgi:hypothetical protein